MTSPPPSDSQPESRPTGPPSGPLSGSPSGAPTEPAHEPTRPWQQPGQATAPGTGEPPPPGGPGGGGGGGGGGGASGGGEHRPWWRSAPRVALAAAAVVVVVVLAVVLTRPGGGGGTQGEVFLEPAASAGQDPFTGSTVNGGGTASPTATPSLPPHGDHRHPSVSGAAPGLYGGSRSNASCDVEKQIRYLQGAPEKARAFAGVVGVSTDQLPQYLRGLTSVQLLVDTRVTNHGFRDGRATSFQAVLQTGTAVMVDAHGVPRVRCACGNPLTPPVPVKGAVKTVGKPWPGYRDANVVAVKPAPHPVQTFTLLDPDTGQYFTRPQGDTGDTDQPTAPPSQSPFSPSPGTPGSTPPGGGSTPVTPSGPGGGTTPETPSGPGGGTTPPTAPGPTGPGETGPGGTPGSPGPPGGPGSTGGGGTTGGSTG
ncbi:hypothetical protein MUU72_20865 [Streptomyces sp. RS10V-4]|uniref:DUF6777 domain-containing protein n=1 Tax=Streptomyces rhizoryzae TaxID=2932493 RepID=UPI00200659F5|nr:DUF6777 domain-containing protein [Streptomyces rhizoryzae]MCK7625519.1 hypothetical protein [Streptomyces rhizoryzae]